jgi:hypothetical protein
MDEKEDGMKYADSVEMSVSDSVFLILASSLLQIWYLI